MRALLVAICLFAVFPEFAGAQGQESFDSIVISCDEAPAEAKTQLPAKLAEWAMLSCTRYGHVLRAASGWIWHNPKTNSFVRIWSQPSAGNLAESGHKNYFNSLDFRQLSPEEADAANAVLAKALGAQPQSVADAFALTLIDAQGRSQTINFVRAAANIRLGNFWGWVCSSPCVRPEVFMGFKPAK